jgi:hypothetical protein
MSLHFSSGGWRMPILWIVVGTVIVFSKVGIGDLAAKFLNLIHQSSSKDTGFRVFLLDVDLYLSTLQFVWLFCWFPVRPLSCQVVVDWKAFVLFICLFELRHRRFDYR